jgi:His-Xaa-Ser system protein HxsD
VVIMLPPSSRETPEELLALFYRELADQELREKVAEQTRDIRALLLAHAFSRTDLVRRD